MLPFLAYTQPRIARNLLRFRHSMLPKARERAAALGQRGATVPVADDQRRGGLRLVPGRHGPVPPQRRHRLRDPPLRRRARRRRVPRRGRRRDPRRDGPLWEDLGFYGDDGAFHIHGVTGPDEYTTVVNDNAYTNLMARLNLSYAAAAAAGSRPSGPRRYAALCARAGLDPSEIDAWERAAAACTSRTTPPRDHPAGRHLPRARAVGPRRARRRTSSRCCCTTTRWSIYRHQVLKQADVVMAMFLLGNEFTLEQKRRNFEYYDPLTTGDSSLSASIQSIVAAEIGDERGRDRATSTTRS